MVRDFGILEADSGSLGIRGGSPAWHGLLAYKFHALAWRDLAEAACGTYRQS